MSLSLRNSSPEDKPQFLRDAGMSLMRVRRYMEMLQSGFPACSQECDDVPLCKGGDLSIPMLLAAYGKGIFPWFNEGDPVLWWSPAPRCVLLPELYHLPKRAARYLKKTPFTFTMDLCFRRVIENCARTRSMTCSAPTAISTTLVLPTPSKRGSTGSSRAAFTAWLSAGLFSGSPCSIWFLRLHAVP